MTDKSIWEYKNDTFLVRHSKLMTKNERQKFAPKLEKNLGVKRGVKVKKSSKMADFGAILPLFCLFLGLNGGL